MFLVEKEANCCENEKSDDCEGKEISESNDCEFHDVFSFYFIVLLDIKWFFSNRKYDFSDLPILLRGLWFLSCGFDDIGFLFLGRGRDCTELRSD